MAAGVCANLDEDDYVTSTHRGHGHCIAKGCDLDRMMAEIYGREDGLCKGRGGSMHIADFRKGMLGANAIVGGGIALATGAALASSVRGSGQVAVAFFGDGAANQGVLHESLNLAAIWRLPVIYVCENNGFAESTPASYATSVPDVASSRLGIRDPRRRHRRRRRARRLRRDARRGRRVRAPVRARRCSRRRRIGSWGTSRAIQSGIETTTSDKQLRERDAIPPLREQPPRRRAREHRATSTRSRPRSRLRSTRRSSSPARARSRIRPSIGKYVYPGAARARTEAA